MSEPTRDQIAKDYATALTIIDGLRTRNAELLDLLKELRIRLGARVADGWVAEWQEDLNAAIAKAEAT